MKAVGYIRSRYPSQIQILCLTRFSPNRRLWAGICWWRILAPQGRLGVIDDPNTLDVTRLKNKAASLRWESMFTRSLYSTVDVEQQHRILNDVSALADQGEVRTTEVFQQQT